MNKELDNCQRNLEMLRRQITTCSQYQNSELRDALSQIVSSTQLYRSKNTNISIDELISTIEENVGKIDDVLQRVQAQRAECLDLSSSELVS